MVSSTVTFVLAAQPDQPSNPPYVNMQGTRAYSIKLSYDALTSAQNGGSPILSYEVAIYNVTVSQWKSIQGGFGTYSLDNTLDYATGITKGIVYQFKYRAWNINGAGPWSVVGNVIAG